MEKYHLQASGTTTQGRGFSEEAHSADTVDECRKFAGFIQANPANYGIKEATLWIEDENGKIVWEF